MPHTKFINGGTVECEHYIEESVAVYLQRDPKGTDTWVLEDPDGGLDTNYDDGPEWRNCECGASDDVHREVAERMEKKAPFPDLEDLFHMMAKSLGYTVTKD
jgi:hypothetical protein